MAGYASGGTQLAIEEMPSLLICVQSAWMVPMTHEHPDDLTDEEQLLFGADNIAADLAVQCRRLREMNVSVSAIALEHVVNTLMTEFWDQGFSQTEIRKAFSVALDDMNRYAAGQERR